MNIITLTSDFGYNDSYVGTMKGVINIINPNIKIIDITHNIKKYSIVSANYIINSFYKYFPENTIHNIVVDPGVGTNRLALIVKINKQIFVCPDNGLLSLILSDKKNNSKFYKIELKKLNKYYSNLCSSTFHGRDIFSPVCGLLSKGVKIENLSSEIKQIKTLNLKPIFNKTFVKGKIIHIDDFGNIITNVEKKDMKNFKLNYVKIKNKIIKQKVDNYDSIKKYAYLFGSNNFLELSMKQKSIAKDLNVNINDDILIK